MIENSSQSPTATNGHSQQSSGCAGAIAILLLFIFPPGGILLLWMKRLWSRGIRTLLTITGLVWLVLPFWIADPDAANDRPDRARNQLTADELGDFRSHIETAISLRQALDDLESEMGQRQKNGARLTLEEFERKAQPVGKRIWELKQRFDEKFGTDIGEFSSRGGKNRLLYQRTAVATTELTSLWTKWHRQISRGTSGADADASSQRFWEDIRDAQKILREAQPSQSP